MLTAALVLTGNSIVSALLYGLIAAVLVYLVAAYIFHAAESRPAAAVTFIVVFLICLLGGVSG